MSTEKITREQISNFVKAKLGIIPVGQAFFSRIGVNGMDANQFMNDFATEFNIDMSDFHGHFYYSDDKLNFGLRKMYPKKSFSIDHLYEVASKQKWFDPVE